MVQTERSNNQKEVSSCENGSLDKPSNFKQLPNWKSSLAKPSANKGSTSQPNNISIYLDGDGEAQVLASAANLGKVNPCLFPTCRRFVVIVLFTYAAQLLNGFQIAMQV